MFDQLIQKFSLQGNWVDLAFILLLIFFILTTGGFIDTFLDVLGFLFSTIFSYKLYSFFGNLLIYNFSLPKSLANAIGFSIAWFISELIFYMLFSYITAKYLKGIEKHPLNKLFGYVAACFQTFVLFLFFISLVFALPVKGQVKDDILHSRVGPFFVSLSQNFEKGIKGIFGDAISETLNFLTVKPESGETVSLGFKLDKSRLSYDDQSEKTMFKQVNEERESRGINLLIFNTQLRDLARRYGNEMLENGFFSHTSEVDNSSPADRANRIGISYITIGENLAFAPDAYVAHQGLMNSEGHRKNILSADYKKVGIGVVDGGVYGKMFVQEFTN